MSYPPPSVEIKQSVARRRHDLYTAMQDLEASAARASGQPDWEMKVGEALRNLMASLEQHVAEIEAPAGLFTEVIDVAPHLSSAVESLRTEHQEMLEVCGSSVEAISGDGSGQPNEIRQQVLRLLGILAVHRQTGAELLYDTYNVDLATGD